MCLTSMSSKDIVELRHTAFIDFQFVFASVILAYAVFETEIQPIIKDRPNKPTCRVNSKYVLFGIKE